MLGCDRIKAEGLREDVHIEPCGHDDQDGGFAELGERGRTVNGSAQVAESLGSGLIMIGKV